MNMLACACSSGRCSAGGTRTGVCAARGGAGRRHGADSARVRRRWCDGSAEVLGHTSLALGHTQQQQSTRVPVHVRGVVPEGERLRRAHEANSGVFAVALPQHLFAVLARLLDHNLLLLLLFFTKVLFALRCLRRRCASSCASRSRASRSVRSATSCSLCCSARTHYTAVLKLSSSKVCCQSP